MKKAVFLINVGSPKSLETQSVRQYLREFLMDKYVVNLFFIFRFMLINFIVIPFRSKKTLNSYTKIWDKKNNISPLVCTTKSLAEKFNGTDVEVFASMRYGTMKLSDQINIALKNGAMDFFFIPLYPHYAESTVLTAKKQIDKILKKNNVRYKIQDVFYDNKEYIDALYDSAKDFLEDYDHIIFSYHSVPISHLKAADTTNEHCCSIKNCCSVDSAAHKTCYKHQCLKTTELFIEIADIDKSKTSIAFQSKIGKNKWITPSLVETVLHLKSTGMKKLIVICPSFVTDCLETLEEVEISAKEIFCENNIDSSFKMIPCLNLNKKWIRLLEKWIKNN